MQLPDPLRQRIEDLADSLSTVELARHYDALSARYRRETAASSFQIAGPGEAIAYAAARLPATYGAVAEVCARLALACPDFAPRTLLDIGAGPGTATLAALQEWSTLETLTLLEPNLHLQDVSRRLIQGNTAYISGTLAQASLKDPHDVVLSSYVLNEISSGDISHEIIRLWNITGGALIVIEPGTPLGYGVILQARETLLKLGANIAAPCPHAFTCPLANTQRWCHFSVRVARSSLHRKLKGDAALGYEDEKFSYIVATRQSPARPAARILGTPHGQKIVELELCRRDGSFSTAMLSKRNAAYKEARKSSWGDGFHGDLD